MKNQFIAEGVRLDTAFASWNEAPGAKSKIDCLGNEQLALIERFFTEASVSGSNTAIAYNNLGYVRHILNDNEGAILNYQRALQIDSKLRTARRNLAILLVKMGREAESLRLWCEESNDADTVEWARGLIANAMNVGNLSLASKYASLLAALRWGSDWYPTDEVRCHSSSLVPSDMFLTTEKLQHDIEQFEYLQSRKILSDEFTPIRERYREIIDRLTARGVTGQVPLSYEDQATIGNVYNRIVHVRDTPRVHTVFSNSWNPEHIASQYLGGPLGLVVVDDFLSPEALNSVRLFCLESTVWSGNRYAHGRLGAFFQDGFNCPLLIQIAEELRRTLSKIIGDRHPLRQMWGFKNGTDLPADSTNHADFAAVNVNFWVTPDDANLEPTSGGLIVYDIDAPQSWDFHTYNRRQDIINPFLRRQNARAINIPYRQNRAIIFNSDLFHATAGLRFKPGYENRRINITMLYGDRQNDTDHKNLKRDNLTESELHRSAAWRSAVFSRFRR